MIGESMRKEYKLKNGAYKIDEALSYLGFKHVVDTKRIGSRGPSYGVYLDVYKKGNLKVEIQSYGFVAIDGPESQIKKLKEKLNTMGFDFIRGGWIGYYSGQASIQWR
jgi:hypothetical protein